MSALFLSTIPFSGFYNSLHSQEIDHVFEQMLTDRDSGSENAPDYIQEAASDAIDFSGVYLDYGRAYAESLLHWAELKGSYESMSSPKFYNFETDRLFVNLTLGDYRKIWRDTDKDAFTERCKEWFTPRDGFIPGYGNDWTQWGRLIDWDHNQIGTLLEVYLEYLYCDETAAREWDIWAEHSLAEGFYCNGEIDGWIHDNANKNLARALNSWDYLQERAKRPIKTLEQWHAARRAQNLPFTGTPLGALL